MSLFTTMHLFRNNVQRIISGKLTLTGKGGEGRFNVRYDSFPLSYDTSLSKLIDHKLSIYLSLIFSSLDSRLGY